MASLVSCLLRNCFDVGIEGNRPPGSSSSSDEEEGIPAPGSHSILRDNSLIEVVVSRQSSSLSGRGSSAAETDSEDGHMEDVNFSDDEEIAEGAMGEGVDPSCCDEGDNTTADNEERSNSRRQQQHHHNPLVSFLQHLGIGRDRAYDSISPATIPPSSAAAATASATTTVVEASSEASTTSANVAAASAAAAVAALGQAASSSFNSVRHSLSNPSTSKQISPNEKKPTSSHAPHLQLASSFNFDTTNSTNKNQKSTNNIPGISKNEIVLPGSSLQKQMALAMKEQQQDLNAEPGDECVICMDNFDPTNPRMPTLCGCGENKTYFHLPCLYQWIQQNRNCPCCGQRLRWEEF